MIGSPLLPYDVRKEIRALVPTWCACAGAIVIAALWRDPRLLGFAALAYGLGCIALGAQAFGHEYSHRTVGLLLSQPSSRHRIFFVKLGTLAAMLLALSLLAWPVVFADARWVRRVAEGDQRMLLVLAAMCAMGIAPALSMLCRNVLAAIVLTVAIPGALIVSGDLIGVGLYGVAQAALVDRFKFAFFWRGMFLICAAAAGACWWMFMRLEAIEGRGTELHLPAWLTGRDEQAELARPGSPFWPLVGKELRLQQVTMVVVALYVAGYFLLVSIARNVPAVADPIPPLSMLYAGLIAMLIGALASAEERQMGTLEWQTLLPMPAWRQWAVKTGVVLALALVLGVALPYAVRMISPVPGDRLAHEAPREILNTTTIVLVLTSVCLYVSSLSTSGVRALVVSLPVLAAAGAATNVGAWIGSTLVRRLGFVEEFRSAAFEIFHAPAPVGVAILLGFAALAVSFAAVNHRSAERPVTRIALQASTLVVYASACTIGFHL